MFVEKLVGDLDCRKQESLVHVSEGSRPFMRPRLLQVDAIAWTVECDFALLAATLRAYAAMDGGTEPFLMTFLADGATHPGPLPKLLLHVTEGRPGGRSGASPC